MKLVRSIHGSNIKHHLNNKTLPDGMMCNRHMSPGVAAPSTILHGRPWVFHPPIDSTNLYSLLLKAALVICTIYFLVRMVVLPLGMCRLSSNSVVLMTIMHLNNKL
jgi:hypothetical protein